MQIKSNDRVTLVGQTGSGKTYLAKRLIAPLRRVLVLDAKDELDDWNTLEFSHKTMRMIERAGEFRLRFTPAPGEQWRYEELFERAYYAGNVTVYIDELTDVVPHGTRPGVYLASLYQRGRALGIGVYASTQRPAWVPLFTLSEAQWLIVFRLRLEIDRKRMASIMGEQVLQPVRDRFGFYIAHQSWSEPRYYRRLG